MKHTYNRWALPSGLKQWALAALLLGAAGGAHAQALNYPLANTQNVAGTYSGLGPAGTAIATANSDDANSAEQLIGFGFAYNGATMDRFILNTNGFVKLGTAGLTISASPLATSKALKRAVSVFPNPSTSGVFSLEIRGANARQNLSVEVTNILGQRVYTGIAKDNFRSEVNLSGVAGLGHLQHQGAQRSGIHQAADFHREVGFCPRWHKQGRPNWAALLVGLYSSGSPHPRPLSVGEGPGVR